MRYTYYSQKMREFDFWLRDIRVYPPEVPAELRRLYVMIEEGYRSGYLDRRKVAVLGEIMRKKFNVEYRIISDRHVVFLPRMHHTLTKYFLKYPQLLAIIGNRHSGKTITAWTLALEALERMPSATLYVYGDVDGLGHAVTEMRPELQDRIIIREDYRLPPLDGKKKIVLYNELAPALLSKRALSTENVELNLQALRSRHLHTWVIYNVIRYSSLEGVLRETADIKLFKWMTGELLYNALGILPKGWSEIFKECISFEKNEGLAVVPAQGRGTMFFIYETNPPPWLLEAHKRAKKNSRLMMVKSEKERYILQRIGELYEKGYSTKEIKAILEKEGITLSERSIQLKRKKYLKLIQQE